MPTKSLSHPTPKKDISKLLFFLKNVSRREIGVLMGRSEAWASRILNGSRAVKVGDSIRLAEALGTSEELLSRALAQIRERAVKKGIHTPQGRRAKKLAGVARSRKEGEK